MKLSKIHHVAIICSDYERSKEFYVKTLGLTICNETYRAERQSYKLDLAVDGVYQIELFSFPDAPPRLSYPEATGLRHLSFAVQDVQACVEELRGKGVQVEETRIDPITGKTYTFFCDPDGLPLELYEDGTI